MSLVDDIKYIQRSVGVEADGVFGPKTANGVIRELGRATSHEHPKWDESILDERTRTNIATLDPKAQDRFEQFALLGKATAATFGCDWVMISGHRTWEEQDRLFAQRPKVTYAAGGYSNHNFGIAGDFGVFRGKSYLDESNPELSAHVHAACAGHARKLGFEWGGDWKGKLKDMPHFQISSGLTMEAKRILYKKEGSIL